MDKKLKDSLDSLKKEISPESHKHYLESAERIHKERIKRLEIKIIKRLSYLIQEKIAVRKKGIKRQIIQEKFERRDLRKVHNKESISTLFISKDGHLKYYFFDPDGIGNLIDFNFKDEGLTDSINRKAVITALLKIYISID